MIKVQTQAGVDTASKILMIVGIALVHDAGRRLALMLISIMPRLVERH